ncbi:MAG: hypothetical protein GX765_01310 [Candidatus Moranbacteria bacterium]|jgi:hypothetical protein|nr:hypothetical protein [Sphingobacteriia bacterium]NLC30673.1 hypothetical protein [Candidatus Moranbacteria bacterium]
MHKICITFAGAIGSSKTPITNFLSTKLNLPVFNNDAIRSEVTEDLGEFDPDEHLKRRNERLMNILEDGTSFICDLSVDREWKDFKKQLSQKGYHVFIISLDLSKDFLVRLYKSKGYFESLKRIDETINDHNIFLDNHKDDILLHILDKNFERRCQISYEEINRWIKSEK